MGIRLASFLQHAIQPQLGIWRKVVGRILARIHRHLAQACSCCRRCMASDRAGPVRKTLAALSTSPKYLTLFVPFRNRIVFLASISRFKQFAGHPIVCRNLSKHSEHLAFSGLQHLREGIPLRCLNRSFASRCSSDNTKLPIPHLAAHHAGYETLYQSSYRNSGS